MALWVGRGVAVADAGGVDELVAVVVLVGAVVGVVAVGVDGTVVVSAAATARAAADGVFAPGCGASEPSPLPGGSIGGDAIPAARTGRRAAV